MFEGGDKIKLEEIYGMYLHGESLESMAATEKQISLIQLIDQYNDNAQLVRDIKLCDSTMKRHLAGIEFCGSGSPRNRVVAAKIDIIIDSIDSGLSAMQASKKAGTSIAWTLETLHKHGYTFDKCLKQWRKGDHLILMSVTIDGKHTNPSIENDKIKGIKYKKLDTARANDKIKKVARMIDEGYTLYRASFLCDIDLSQASKGLRGLGYTYESNHWVKQP